MSLEIASAVEDGLLAGIEDGARGCGEGELGKFVLECEHSADGGFVRGGDFDGDGRHGTSVSEEGIRGARLPNPRHHHQRT